jgi:hypothetical protein
MGGSNVGKITLTDAPTAGYELEVRAIQTGTTTAQQAGTLVAPVREKVDVELSTAVSGNVDLDLTTQQVYFFNGEASADFTLNLRGTAQQQLNEVIASGESIATTVLVNMGASLYSLTAINVDGAAATVKWINNNSVLTANKLNVISLVVIKTGNASYTVVGNVSAAG